MKKYKLIIGIDVSKNKLDVCFMTDPDLKDHSFFVVSNDKNGAKKILGIVKKMKIELKEVLICFENTGVYSLSLAYHLNELTVDYWEVPAIEIKRSKGLTRGKNDRTDAKDIAFYAHTHMHKLKLSKIPEKDIAKLKLLYTERGKILKSIHIFEMANENKGFLHREITREALSINKKTLKYLRKILLETEQKIQGIIKENSEVHKQYELIRSVQGVGTQTATYLIIVTKGFTAFSNWRKLACYGGIAPFEHTSGTSIKGRTKVSHMADKKLKSLLTMCALSAKKHDREIALYYQRKTEEGKNPMLVLNSIRCKVLSRVFAVVNRGTPYVNTCKYAA